LTHVKLANINDGSSFFAVRLVARGVTKRWRIARMRWLRYRCQKV